MAPILGRVMSNTVLTTPAHCFKKEQRLLTPTAFRKVFDAPERKLHQSHIMAFIRTNELDKARIGMAITKRKVPTAVKRNLLKRLIRENFRTQYFNLKNKDIVFIVKNSIKDITNQELKKEINTIFKKLENK